MVMRWCKRDGGMAGGGIAWLTGWLAACLPAWLVGWQDGWLDD